MPKIETSTTLGARVLDGRTEFRVWAPACESVILKLEDGHEFEMHRDANGVFSAEAPVGAGGRYFYVPRSKQNSGVMAVPDPVSRFLPEGLHGATEIVDPESFRWSDDAWRGLALDDYIIYELHTGTFTAEGTFDAIIPRLEYLKQLGITVIEIMPVAAFPGRRNWGYDGASPYAVQASYGGPEGLKRLVNAAHQAGLAVVLDVVYNHLGPEGNYLRMFGPYFTDRHQTPWGDGLNYDGPDAEPVRRYFVENALYWVREYHVDGLRLDAVQTIKDDSPRHIVSEIRDDVKALARELGRNVCVIAETDENDVRYLKPKSQGGYELDAVWSDDFHHAVHTLLTSEKKGYYQDFGKPEQVARALNQGFVFQGEHFQYWGKPRGTSTAGIPMQAHIVCIQNHDQVGNRAMGDRLGQLIPRGAQKFAAALLLLSPATPLLFMGEEYGSTSPFQFFTDFGDQTLQKAVSEGRRHEFAEFDWKDVPDPQDQQTFERSRINWDRSSEQKDMLRWYRDLIALRKQYVITNPRLAIARTRESAIISRSPRDNPILMILAELPGSVPFEDQPCWSRVLESDSDGYRVRIFTRDPGSCDPTGAID